MLDRIFQNLGKNKFQLSDIEKRQQELDEKLYELANKHKNTKIELGNRFKMQDGEDSEDENKKSLREKRMEALNKRYIEEDIVNE